MKRKQRSGRKAGGDVLKEIDPAGSALANAEQLAFGQDAGNSVVEMVGIWRSIELEAERLAQREKELGPERIEAAASLTDQQATDVEAACYCEDKRKLDAWVSHEQRRFTTTATLNLRCHRAAWFRKVADAIEREFTPDGQDRYPLHSAALVLLSQLETAGGHVIKTNAALSQTARYTVGQAADILEAHGHRPQGQGDEDWRRTVRRACRAIGVPLAPSNPGPVAER